MATDAPYTQNYQTEHGIFTGVPAQFGAFGEKPNAWLDFILPWQYVQEAMQAQYAAADGTIFVGSELAGCGVPVVMSGDGTLDETGAFQLAEGVVGETELADASVTPPKLSETYIPVVGGTPTAATGNAAVTGSFTAALLQALITSAAAKGLLVKAASSQTANLLEVQDSSGTVLFKIEANGDADFMDAIVNIATMNVNTINLNGSSRNRGNTLPTSGMAAGDRYEFIKTIDGITSQMDFEYDGSDWISTESWTITDGGSAFASNFFDQPFPKGYESWVKGWKIDSLDINIQNGDAHGSSPGQYYNVWLETVPGFIGVVAPAHTTPDPFDTSTLVADAPFKMAAVYGDAVKILKSSGDNAIRLVLNSVSGVPGYIGGYSIRGRFIGTNPV